jgi:hypothetical protein
VKEQSIFHTLTIADIMQAATVALAAGTFTKIGQWVTPAQNHYGMGYGDQTGQQNSRGRIYIDLKDNGVAPGVNIDGVFRIQAVDANDSPIGVVAEYRTEKLRSDIADPQKQISFPEHGLFLSEDNKFIFEVKADAAATLSKANSKALVDVTKIRR